MANKVYYAPETAITFQDSGGSAVLTLNNLAAATGRVSARYDRGSGSKPRLHLMRCKFEKGVAGVVGQVINVYVFTSDGTNVDGNVGVSDAPMAANLALNAFSMSQVVVTTTSTNTAITQSFLVEIPERYISIGVINSTTGLLRASANTSTISLTPIPDEIQ